MIACSAAIGPTTDVAPPAIARFRARFGQRASMPRLEPFGLPKTRPGKRMRALTCARGEEIAKGNAEWEIIGATEIRDVDAGARYFTPFRVRPHAEAMRMFANGRRRSILIWSGRRRSEQRRQEAFAGLRDVRRRVLRATATIRPDAGCRATNQREGPS